MFSHYNGIKNIFYIWVIDNIKSALLHQKSVGEMRCILSYTREGYCFLLYMMKENWKYCFALIYNHVKLIFFIFIKNRFWVFQSIIEITEQSLRRQFCIKNDKVETNAYLILMNPFWGATHLTEHWWKQNTCAKSFGKDF